MRARRWIKAVTATSCGRHRATAGGLTTNAFVNFLAAPSRSSSRFSALPRCSSTCVLSRGWKAVASAASAAGGRRSTTAISMERDGEDRQSWCGHELLNTVTTDWVEDNLGNPEVALVDIRGRVIKHRDDGSDFFSTAYEGLRDDYLDAHIPGAVFVDWTKDIARTGEDGVPAQLTDRQAFVAAMEEKGVGAAKRVVVYDNGDMLFATRFWWAMRRFGHDRVSVMDGGWAKWQAEGREFTPDCPCPLKVYTDWAIPPERERPGLVAGAADVRAALGIERQAEKEQEEAQEEQEEDEDEDEEEEEGKGAGEGVGGSAAVQLLDARAAAQFSGQLRRARRGGRIPGAVNTPYRSFLAEGEGPDGKFRVFKDLEGIKQVFESALVDTSPSAAPVIAYCNGGVASTVVLFLLFQLRQLTRGGGGRDRGGGGGTST
ncbi:unnamed protein product, partial [Pylaiella littoralis]